MTPQVTSRKGARIPLGRISVVALLVWTLIAISVYVCEVNDNRNFVQANAKAIARASFEKDIAFRRWAAMHGGVFVPSTAETPPNPYLNVPERDIATPSGRQLTLMNPAYMIRQVYEIMLSVPDAPKGHITSLKPIRPENAPDDWERKALASFEKGVMEFSEYQEIGGKRYFRYMHALKTEKGCLKCHAAQGYREGDVRGGISVTIPVAELERTMYSSNGAHAMIVSIVWCLGTLGIWYGNRIIGRGARALEESEERYRQQFKQSMAVMLIIDPGDGAIIDANAAACSFYGYAIETLQTLKIVDINTSTPSDLAKLIDGVLDGSIRQFPARHRLSDGTVRDVEVFSNPLDYQGKMLLHSIVMDTTSRLAAEQELRNKMDFAENLILNSTTPTFVIDSDHKVLIWNRALEELTGTAAQEMVGSRDQWRAFYSAARPCLADIVVDGKQGIPSDLYAHYSRSRLIPDGMHAEGDFTFRNRRCRLVFSAAPIRDHDGRIIAAIETLEDITERISLETQLFQAQKMESVGVLAGGIAHDFNNVLTVISGYTDLLKLSLKEGDQNMSFAEEISSSVARGANMARSLLAFSGKHELMLQCDDLNQILASMQKGLGRLIREDIALTIRADMDRLPVYVDRVQIEQLLINLVINASDAMGTGGTITVSAKRVTLAEAHLGGDNIIPAGNYACLSVSDDGDGMDAETVRHIFEPFYTTKERGKGTGLGLAIVRSVVVKHNGFISVVSTPGIGTEFVVHFPLFAGGMNPQMSEAVPEVDLHGTESVLMVEDDADIMKLHEEVLGRFGYTVLSGADGVEGLEAFNAHCDTIGIAVVDVIMPRMNGRELVEQIRRRKPALPVIMVSGYTDEIIDRSTIEALKVIFLQKPVRPLDLLAAIRSALQMRQ